MGCSPPSQEPGLKFGLDMSLLLNAVVLEMRVIPEGSASDDAHTVIKGIEQHAIHSEDLP